MRIDVAFTPGEAAGGAAVALVVDVLRATTTIAYAFAAGFERVLACAELEQARDVAGRLRPDAVLAGERACVRPDGFDRGNSPREFSEGAGSLVLSTTNGTRALVVAADRADLVLAASLANLTSCAAAAARHARAHGGDVLVQCAGVRGAFTLDDAYVAGRYVAELRVWLGEWERSDAATAAEAIADAFGASFDGLAASRSARNLRAANLFDDVRFCARESVLDVVPAVADLDGGVALLSRHGEPAVR